MAPRTRARLAIIAAAILLLAGAGWLVLGVFIGSSVWWLSLAALAGRFRRQLAEGGLATVNRLSGLLLLGFALYGLGSVLWMWSQGTR